MVQADAVTVPPDAPGEHWRISKVSWQAADTAVGQGTNVTWAYQQKENVPSGLAPATVRLGASGLHAGKQQLFRVAYCATRTETQELRCTCYSEWSATATTDDVTSTAPAGQYIMVEDKMRRWNTSTQPAGDGLGPAWRELISPGAFGHAVISGTSYALMSPLGTNLQFKPFGSDYPRTYVEALYLKHPNTTDGRYNVDVRAREFLSATEVKSYTVKLANETDLGTSTAPFLRFLRFRGTTIEPVGDGIYPLASLGCSEDVPLATSNSIPVWLRIIVEDNQDNRPVITATVGWGNCGENDSIDACVTKCTKSVADSEDPFGLAGQLGTWGVFNHHGEIYLGTVRAGSGL